MEMGIEPGGLLGLAEEMAGRAREEDAGHAALAVLAAGGARTIRRAGGAGGHEPRRERPRHPGAGRGSGHLMAAPRSHWESHGVVALFRRSLLLGVVLIVIGIFLGGLNVL